MLENTTINISSDEPMIYGNMFILLLNSMRSNINDSTQKLWDYSLNLSSYNKTTGKIISINDSEFVVSNDTENINLIWEYEEDISSYLMFTE